MIKLSSIKRLLRKKMNCRVCRSAEGELKEFPFEILEILLRNPLSHQDVYIHRCKGCGLIYVGLGIQAYDDNLAYWAQATDSEISRLRSLKDTPELFESTKKLIESKVSHIYGAFDGKYYFKNEPAFILSDMPPW